VLQRTIAGFSARARTVAAELGEALESRQEFLLLLALFLTSRMSLLLISRPQGYLEDSSDYDFYLQFGQMADRGLLPDIHYWTEYPPVFPWIAVAAYRITELIPTLGGYPILWFRLALGSILLLFDLGNLVLLYRLAGTIHDPARALRTAWVYALLFTPLHVWLGWFDTMPLFFLLLGVMLTVKGRYRAAAVISGFGFMVKVLPILALPVLLKVERRFRQRVELVALAGLAIGLVAAPFLLLAPQYLIASFRSLVSRSPWETVWAISEGYFGYGWVAPLQERIDPSTASYTAYPSHLPWAIISTVFAALYLALWTRGSDLRQPAKAVAFAGLSLNLFMLYSKGYSPQFLVYLVPFALLVLPQWRAVGYLTVLSAINLLEYPTYMVLFRSQEWMMRDLVAGRAVILLGLCWEYLAALELLPSLALPRRLAASGAMVGFVAWGMVTLPGAGQQWVHYAQQHDPNAPLVNYLSANAGPSSAVILTDPGLYRALYPYLYRRTNLLLVDPAPAKRSASIPGADRRAASSGIDLPNRVQQISSEYEEVFDVRGHDDAGGKDIEQLLAAQRRLVNDLRVNDLSVTVWGAK
jgi:hypothetical protein